MPCVASLEAFQKAITGFVVADAGLVIEPAALATARQSLDSAGLLLARCTASGRTPCSAGTHAGIRLISVALEWPEDLAPMIQAFLVGGTLADDVWLVRG